MKRTALITVFAAVVLALAGCGGSIPTRLTDAEVTQANAQVYAYNTAARQSDIPKMELAATAESDVLFKLALKHVSNHKRTALGDRLYAGSMAWNNLLTTILEAQTSWTIVDPNYRVDPSGEVVNPAMNALGISEAVTAG